MMIASGPILPGFRFHPTDQELIIHYLRKKVSSSSDPEISIIADVNIYQFNPWDLPGKALFGETEWFFFSPRDRKYPNGARPNRAAASGYWKATGTDKPILSHNKSQCLGVKKSLVFCKGRAPKGTKTEWMMMEYRLLVDNHHQLHKFRGSMRLDDWVLCRVRQKATPQPKEEPRERSSGDSIPYTFGYLQGQETTEENNNLNIFDYCFQYPFLAQLESEETDEQGPINWQDGSPDHSASAVCSSSHPSTNPSFKDAIESIKKVLSIGNLEDLEAVSPEKMLHLSPSFDSDIGSISQVSSPTTQASCSYGFTGSKF